MQSAVAAPTTTKGGNSASDEIMRSGEPGRRSEPAFAILVFRPHLNRQQRRFAVAGIGAGHRHAEADFDGFGCRGEHWR